MDERAVEQAATLLAEARLGARPLKKLPEGLAPATLEEAYRVQNSLSARLSQSGLGAVVGHKIGCTTRVMQDYLGIPHPCAGALFAATVRTGEGVFERSALCRPGVECEIAVRLGRDMDAPGPFSTKDAAAAVETAMASIELVDDRWTDFSIIAPPSLVSEHFFNAGCVLGPAVAVDPAGLGGLRGEMRVGGESVGSGTGADILGDPMAALAWLASHQQARGAPLRAGDVVTLGSLVKTAWIGAGDSVQIEIDRLGRAALTIV